MDLVAYCQSTRADAPVDHITDWLEALRDDPWGQFFVRNLEADCCLELSVEGQSALASLIISITDVQDSASPLADLHAELEARPATYICQGAQVPTELETNDLSHVRSLESALRHLVNSNLLQASSVIAEASGRTEDRDARRAFAQTFLERAPDRALTIPTDTPVRGRLPLVFAAPQSDLPLLADSEPSATQLCQLIGVPTYDDDLCVLGFRQSHAGEAHVPTALDAWTHEHFWAPEPGALWGRTCDLADGVSVGVREGVVQAFRAELIERVQIVAQE